MNKRLATIIALLLLYPACGIYAQRAEQLLAQAKMELRAMESEHARLKTEGARLKAEQGGLMAKWNQLQRYPLSEERLAAENILLGRMHNVNDRIDNVNHGYDMLDVRHERWNILMDRADQALVEEMGGKAPPTLAPKMLDEENENDCLIVATQAYKRLRQRLLGKDSGVHDYRRCFTRERSRGHFLPAH